MSLMSETLLLIMLRMVAVLAVPLLLVSGLVRFEEIQSDGLIPSYDEDQEGRRSTPQCIRCTLLFHLLCRCQRLCKARSYVLAKAGGPWQCEFNRQKLTS